MRSAKYFALAAAWMMAAQPLMAAELPPPPPAPYTLWNFLGIPQGLHKIRDATSNRRGNHPGLERRPPLKALADPINLLSPNPAIKKAAEIKVEEDLAPQKIKAIKYLARIGCGCYPGVKEALMAALDDCTEEVRYQAALAILDAASNHCETCNRNCCCDQDMSLKLAAIAYEMTDKCCFLEPSERVREAAKAALRVCCPNTGPPPITEPAEPVPPPVLPPPERPREAGTDGGADARTAMLNPGVHHMGNLTHRLPQVDAIASDDEGVTEYVTVTFDPPTAGRPATMAQETRETRVHTHGVSQSNHRHRSPVELQHRAAHATPHRQPQVVRYGDAHEASVVMPERQQPREVAASEAATSRRQARPRGVAAAHHPAQIQAQVPAPTPDAGYIAQENENAAMPQVTSGKLEGAVARVNSDSGTVELKFPRGNQPAPGTRFDVTHKFLLGSKNVGQLEVIAVGASMVTARPVGDMSLSTIARGDLVTRAEAVPTLASAPSASDHVDEAEPGRIQRAAAQVAQMVKMKPIGKPQQAEDVTPTSATEASPVELTGKASRISAPQEADKPQHQTKTPGKARVAVARQQHQDPRVTTPAESFEAPVPTTARPSSRRRPAGNPAKAPRLNIDELRTPSPDSTETVWAIDHTTTRR